MGLEEIIAPAPEVIDRVAPAYSVQVTDAPAPMHQVEEGLRYHFSQ
jgi:hypothetical protein